MQVSKVKISEVKNNPKNPRLIKDDKFKKLVKSIQEFPQMLELRPIVVDENNIVLGGNMRLKACKEAGMKEVYIVKAENLTEQQKDEFIVKDNVGFGEWDWDMLANEWDTEKLNDWGLDLPVDLSVQEELEAEEDDYEIPNEINTDIVLGDLFEIGEHRLLCGDSTDSDQVAKLMNGEKADMVFTDPPYLMDFTGGIHADGSKSFNSKHGVIKNDKMSKEDGDDFLDAINANIQLFVNGAFYICFYRLKLGEYFESLKRTGLEVRALITWNKGNHTLSNSDYMSKCEHIFYGWVKEHNFYGGNNGMDIWDIPRTQKNELHPTMKPIPLCEKAISDASKAEDKVLDLFLGSGSTMVAAHQLKRKCYGMELDSKYCQVILERMIKLDPTLKVKKNGEDYTLSV
jgi:site-specific DNA-methyltransferase (adenine-specific)